MTGRTIEEARLYARIKNDKFSNSLSPELKACVEALPLRVEVMNAKISGKLGEIYKTADIVFSQAITYSACVKGCYHCCYQAVPITSYEACYIGEQIETPCVKLKRSNPRDEMSFSDQTPCTFLINNECSIYKCRPLTCRTHVNFDRDDHWCRYENWDRPGATIYKPIFKPLWLAHRQLAGRFEPIIGDIRDFFPSGRALTTALNTNTCKTLPPESTV